MFKMGMIELVVFWLLLIIALGFAMRRLFFLVGLIKMGKKMKNSHSIAARTKVFLGHVLGQRCNIRNVSTKDLAGLGHIFIFYGFVVFLINYIIFLFIGDGFGVSEVIRNHLFSYYFLYLSDIIGILFVIAIISVAVRRSIIRPTRLEPGFDAGLFWCLTVFIFLLFLCYFSLEGLRINAGINAFRTPVAGIFADLFNNIKLIQQNQDEIFRNIFRIQYIIILGFVIYVPYSHHQHPLFCPFNIFFKSFSPIGEIKPVDFDRIDHFGASRVEDFTRKQLLEGFACTHCGRCQDNCPMYLTDKDFSPKMLLLNINAYLIKVGGSAQTQPPPKKNGCNFPQEITKEILSCATCGACMDICPVFNRHVDVIIELRRNMVYNGIFDSGHKMALQRTSDNFNPWGISWNIRAENIDIEQIEEGKKYDVLYWIGCTSSSVDRARDIALAVASILEKTGIKVGILGNREKCCGDFARRIGDEGLFQKLAIENIKTISRFKFDSIITHCPHCYNTLKNEYPAFGAKFKVIHHTEFILNLINNGMIKLDKINQDIVYHDPCYLGRYNGIYNEPRRVLSFLSEQITELPRSFEKSFCCGAGGGHIWKDRETGKRMNNERAEEIIESKTENVAVACPFCLLMLEEAIQVKGLEGEIKVKDVAELVEKACI